MARQIHRVDGVLLCEKRRQRSEIFELGIDGMEDDQRWAIARHLVSEAKLVGDPHKPRFYGDAFAESGACEPPVRLRVRQDAAQGRGVGALES